MTNKTSYAPFSDCLPFMKGEILEIVSVDKDGRVIAENRHDIKGYINAHHVRIAESYLLEDWYLKDFTAKMVVNLLADKEYGTFVVRTNSRDPTKIVISAKFSSIIHYSFPRVGDGLNSDGVVYKTVIDFVEKCNKEVLLEGYLRIWIKQSDVSLPPVPVSAVTKRGMNLRIVAGNKAVALETVTACNELCLPLVAGKMYTIIKACRDPHRYIARDENDNEGYVPSAFLECFIPHWFHGLMEREEAEQILNMTCRDGTFLVRERRNKPGWFALSVWCPDGIVHVPLEYVDEKFRAGSDSSLPKFDNLLDLVDHYRRETAFWTINNECVRMLFPLSREEASVPEAIRHMDIDSIELYMQALKRGKEHMRDIRLMFVGHFGAGKTTLAERLMGRPFDKATKSTNGIDIFTQKCTFTVKTGKWFCPRTSEAEEQDYARRLINLIESPQEGGFSILEEFKRLTSVDDSDGNKRNSCEIKIVKTDDPFSDTELDSVSYLVQGSSVPDRCVSPRRIDSDNKLNRFDDSYEIDCSEIPRYKFSEGTLKTISNVFGRRRHSTGRKEKMGFITLWDFAGQYIFYATHQVFLSPRAVYLLTLDLRKSLNDFVEYDDFPLDASATQGKLVRAFGDFWLRSIHTFCGDIPGQPPVILVGTHKEKLNCAPEERDLYIERYFEEFRKHVENSPVSKHIQPEQFAIDNSSPDEAFDELKEAIVKVAKRQSFWDEEVPARWIPLERTLVKMRPFANTLSVNEVKQIDATNEIAIKDEEEILLFLRYHHALGSLIYFEDDDLSDTVVLDPQWIIDGFKSLITAKQFCLRHAELRDLWNMLQQLAILKDDLIDEIWKTEQEGHFMKDKQRLLLYMEKLDIIARPEILSKEGERDVVDFYFVPSLLKEKGKSILPQLASAKICSTPYLCFAFDEGFIPPAIFHRLLGACLSTYSVMKIGGKLLLYSDVGVFKLNEQHCFLVSITDNVIKVRVVNLTEQKPVPAQCDKLRRYLTAAVQKDLGRYHQNTPFSICIQCERTDRASDDLINCRNLLKHGKLPCCAHDNPHTVHSEVLLATWYPDYIEVPTGKRGSVGWVDDLPSVARNRTVTYKDLSSLSKCLGFNWEFVLLELGQPQVAIDQSKMDNPYKTAFQIYDALLKWKKEQGKEATMQTVIKAIEANPVVEVNWEMVKNIADRI